MLACQSKLALGSRSHQLLITVVSRSSTSVLTDVTDAGECVSECMQAFVVDFYTNHAEWRVKVCKRSKSWHTVCKVCVSLSPESYLQLMQFH